MATLKMKSFMIGLLILVIGPAAFASEPACIGSDCALIMRKADTETADQLMLQEQEDIVGKVHELKLDIKRDVTELSQERALRSKDELRAIVARAKNTLETISTEVSVQYDTFSKLNRRRWRSENPQTDLYHRGLYNRKDIAAFDDRVAKLNAEINEINELKRRLAPLLESLSDENNFLSLFVSQLFGKEKSPVAESGSEAQKAALIQLTVDNSPSVATTLDRKAIDCPVNGVCFSSQQEAATLGAGNPDNVGLPDPNWKDDPSLNYTQSYAQPVQPLPSFEARPQAEICDRSSGPYCGKSLSEVLDMKRQEGEF